jgi:hypothetical protein
MDYINASARWIAHAQGRQNSLYIGAPFSKAECRPGEPAQTVQRYGQVTATNLAKQYLSHTKHTALEFKESGVWGEEISLESTAGYGCIDPRFNLLDEGQRKRFLCWVKKI